MRCSRDQVAVAFRTLLAGGSISQAAAAAGIHRWTVERWLGVGAPVSIDGVPAGRPLAIAVAEQIGAK